MDFSQMSNDELLGMYNKLNSGAKGGAGGTGAAKLSPQDAKALQALRDKSAQSLNTATQAERFLDINKHVPTGGLAGAPIIGDWVRQARGAMDPDFAQMESINASVAPGMRPPGSGSTSNKDMALYAKGFTNTQVPYQSNVETYDRLHADSDKNAAHAAFVDKWAQTRGTLEGAEPAFLQYWAQKSANPGQALKDKSAQTRSANDPLGIR